MIIQRRVVEISFEHVRYKNFFLLNAGNSNNFGQILFMKPLRWLFLASASFLCYQLSAQARLGFIIDSFPPIMALNDTAQYTRGIFIKNYGNAIFSDTVRMRYMVNDTGYSGSMKNVGLYLRPDTTYLLPGASVRKELIIEFNLPNFQYIGSSVVVIWPISDSAATNDSVIYNEQIVDSLTAGVVTNTDGKLRVFMQGQQLVIDPSDENFVGHLSLYNALGKLLLNREISASTIIPMDRYSFGCYFAELTLLDESKRIFKVMNTPVR